MKRIVFMLCMLPNLLPGQQKQEDVGKVLLSIHIPEAAGMSAEAKKFLNGRLTQLLTQDGMAGGVNATRFALVAEVITGTKDIIAGPPQMIAQQLELNLIIGDAVANRQFASFNMSLKGVGTNETKSLTEAFKGVNPSNADLRKFVQSGKEEIVNYYLSGCEGIIKEAGSLAKRQQYEEAIYRLSLVPEAAAACYSQAGDSMAAWFQEKLNKDSRSQLSQARSIWAAGQNTDAALEAIGILQNISPGAGCQKEVDALIKSIETKVKADAKARWDQQVKEYNDRMAAEKEQQRREAEDAAFRRQAEMQRLQNYRAIAIEQARNRPPVTINHIHWR